MTSRLEKLVAALSGGADPQVMAEIGREIERPDSELSQLMRHLGSESTTENRIDWMAVLAAEMEPELPDNGAHNPDEKENSHPYGNAPPFPSALEITQRAIEPQLARLANRGFDDLIADFNSNSLSVVGADVLASATSAARVNRFLDTELIPVCEQCGTAGNEVLQLLEDQETRFSASRLAVVVSFLAVQFPEWRELPIDQLVNLASIFVEAMARRQS